MAPLSFTILVGCCIIVLGDLDMRCRLSLVLIYVSLLFLVGCGTNFSLSHKTTPSFLTPRTEQTPYTEFALPQLSEKDCASGPQGISIGPDGALWFTDSADKIGRITTQGQITEFALSTWAHPMGSRPGPMEPSGLPRAGVRLGRSPRRGTSPYFPHTIQAGPGGLSLGPMALFG